MTYSKRTGLQKAVHQVEEAIRKSHTQNGDYQAVLPGVDLQQLLTKTRHVRDDTQVDFPASDLAPTIPPQHPHASSGHLSSAGEANLNTNAVGSQPLDRHPDTGDLADAENPLQLLAQTSELVQASTAAGQNIGSTSVPGAVHMKEDSRFAAKSDGIDHFFGRFRPKIDIEPDLDPIEIGLITLSEADALFDLYDAPFLRFSL